ncbi:unnamed protein product [Pedinophyceae sp. YPF-701]|nr:unnamed protein product [Pedinophyceae sp. YPF-701]
MPGAEAPGRDVEEGVHVEHSGGSGGLVMRTFASRRRLSARAWAKIAAGVALGVVGFTLLMLHFGGDSSVLVPEKNPDAEQGTVLHGGTPAPGDPTERPPETDPPLETVPPLSTATQAPEPASRGGVPTGAEAYELRVVAEYPHDPAAFTQGIEYDQYCPTGPDSCEDTFLESTGLYGESTLRRVRLSTGEVIWSRDLDSKHFGEGSARVGDKLYQLIWQTGEVYLWDLSSEPATRETLLPGPLSDGWGLAYDGQSLIATDSGDTLHFLAPGDSLTREKSVKVTSRGRPVPRLNELEVVQGEVWANVWYRDCVARIDKDSGNVIAWIDARPLHQRVLDDHGMGADVLNGIAWDAATGRLWLTGKLWPKVYEVEVVPAAQGVTAEALQTACMP